MLRLIELRWHQEARERMRPLNERHPKARQFDQQTYRASANIILLQDAMPSSLRISGLVLSC
jgi:hypothetical protein